MKRPLARTLIACGIIAGCTSSPRFATMEEASSRVDQDQFSGIASYYAAEFNGKSTANGEVFDMNGLTAAHRTLPFNTRVKVRNLSNGREVEVRINDRGPFVNDRVIDLSLEAARRINMIGTGTARVELEVIELGENP